jgi:hypothetical protein
MSYFLEYRSGGGWAREPSPIHRRPEELPDYAKARAGTLSRQTRVVEIVERVVCGSRP